MEFPVGMMRRITMFLRVIPHFHELSSVDGPILRQPRCQVDVLIATGTGRGFVLYREHSRLPAPPVGNYQRTPNPEVQYKHHNDWSQRVKGIPSPENPSNLFLINI
jgi:hypothetical protein